MLGNQQLAVPFVPHDDIIPALAKIAFHVPGGWSFNHCVSVVPVMRDALLFVATQRGGVVMGVRIPAVEIAAEFNQHINAADEGMGAIHDRDFLM